MQVDNEMQIREFHPEDMKIVTGLLQSVSKFEPKNESLEQLANSFLAGKGRYACVASNGGRVIGFGSVFLLQRIRGGCSAVVEDIVVEENFRRHGVGRRIVGELVGYAKSKGCFKVTLVAGEHNIPFYESLGFREENRSMQLLF
jgi:GNAT superfamily N-acetyltransferase